MRASVGATFTIQPVLNRRCVADKLNLERARAILTEAAEQCARTALPEIAEPVKLDALLRGWEAGRKLDDGIVAAHWLTLDEVKTTQARHRSPLILRCIEDLLAGKRYPLDLLVHYD